MGAWELLTAGLLHRVVERGGGIGTRVRPRRDATTEGATGRRRGAGGGRRRANRSASSTTSCGRAVPESCADRLRPPAGGWRTHGAAGAGGGAAAAGCSCRDVGLSPRGRARSRRLAPVRVGPDGGNAPASARPPRREERCALFRPCPARGRVPARNRR